MGQGQTCYNCQGLGVEACGFCRGSGWPERDSVPPELRRAVLERQFRHVHDELGKMQKALDMLKMPTIRQLDQDSRRALGTRLTRLEARLRDLAGGGVVIAGRKPDRLIAVADHVGACLKRIVG